MAIRRKKKAEAGKTKTTAKKKQIGFRLLLLLALLATAGFVAWNILCVQTVAITGNKRLGVEEIIKIAGIPLGDNIFKINLGDVRRNLESNPYIEVLSVSRILPDTIDIQIHERIAFAVISVSEGQVVIDEAANVLEILLPSASVESMIRVRGMQLIGYKAGETVSTEDDFQATTLIALMNALSKAGMQDAFVEMDVGNPLDLRLLTADGITVRLGQSEQLDEKLAWVRSVLPELAEMGKTGGTLYATGVNSVTYSDEKTTGEEPDPGQDPDQNPEQNPEQDPGQDPNQNPEQDPVQDPEQSPGQDPEQSPGQDPAH